MKKYVIIDHLQLQRAVKKVFDFDKKNNARNTSAIEEVNDHEEDEEKNVKKMTNEQQKNEADEENEQKNKNEREQNEIQYINFAFSNFDDDVEDFNLEKNDHKIFLESLSISQFEFQTLLDDSQSQTLFVLNFMNEKMKDVSMIFVIFDIEVTEEIKRENLIIDNTIQETKEFFESLSIVFDFENDKKKTSNAFDLTMKRRAMIRNENSTSLFRRTKFAIDMIKIIFHDSDLYLKTVIEIDERVYNRRFSCDCSLSENEEFQKKITMYIFEKQSLESTK